MSDMPLYKPVMAVLPVVVLRLSQKESTYFRRHYPIFPMQHLVSKDTRVVKVTDPSCNYATYVYRLKPVFRQTLMCH